MKWATPEPNPTRIAVTGAAGFLGQHLLLHLRQTLPAAELFGVVRQVPNPPMAGVQYLTELPPVALVFHLVGTQGPGVAQADPQTDLALNVGTTLALLEDCSRRTPPPRIVLASSAAVYGAAEGAVSEAAPRRPISAYGLSKRCAEDYGAQYAVRCGLDVRVARISNAYGPWLQRLVVFDLIRRVLGAPLPLRLEGTGEEIRDFIHARDVAAGLTVIGLRGAVAGVYNLGAGRPITIRTLAEAVLTAAGEDPRALEVAGDATPGKVRHFVPNLERISALGFQAKVPLAVGVHETLSWVRSQGWD